MSTTFLFLLAWMVLHPSLQTYLPEPLPEVFHKQPRL